MQNLYPKRTNVPIPSRIGLVSSLRTLAVGESIEVPEKKKSAIHPAAKRAGIHVTLRTLGNGMIGVWRIPAPTGSAPATDPVSPAVPAQVRQPRETNPAGGRYVHQKYGPTIFVPDPDFGLEEEPATKKDIFG